MYLSFGDEWLGLRPADGGSHRYYDVGLEHLAFEVDTGEEVDADCVVARDVAFFVFDPDGLRIEVFSPGTEWSSRIHGPR